MAINIRDLKLESPAFGHHGEIPARHTGEGEDLAPEIRWSGVPDGTRELALICHDPDAPLAQGFTHWLVYGIPPDAEGIPRAAASSSRDGTTLATRGTTAPCRPRATTTSGSTRSIPRSTHAPG
jgi:Raf kinase inhibitor-like YbhB/YbcL family protein